MEHKEVVIKVKYQLGHTYDHTLVLQEDLFCPKCGNKGLWEDVSSDDYYVGTPSYCLKCKHRAYINNLNEANDREDKQILKGINQHVADSTNFAD